MTNIPDNVTPIFERWYLNKYDLDYYDTHRELQMEWFWHLPFEMQSGVWIKFCEDTKKQFDDENPYKADLIDCIHSARRNLSYNDSISVKSINKALELISKTIEK